MSATGAEASARAILYAFVANFGIAITKTWAAMFTGSGSMLAEAIHSYADSGNQVLLYLGLRGSQRPADAEHPLGYGKLSYFWSFHCRHNVVQPWRPVFSIYEGIHKLQQPEELNKVWVALLVLAVAIVLEGFSLAGCLREIRRLRQEKTLRHWLKVTRNAELVVVLGEDIAAQTGLVLAMIFLGISALTGDPLYDALGSICIGAVLIVVSVFVALRMRSLIIGRSAEPEMQAQIDQLIADDPAIERLF